MSEFKDIKRIHFIGIGGISLSALAKLMLLWGKSVSGSDITFSDMIIELMEKGADIWIGNEASLVGRPDLTVYTSAVSKYDKELCYCEQNNILTMERHEFLGMVAKEFESTVAIGGTHGKTTACGMLCTILKEANKPFCGHIGGEVKNNISNLYFSGKDFFITEACEYKKSLLSLPANIALILNAEIDHPDTYKSLAELYDTFDIFLFSKKNCLPLVCSDCRYYIDHIKNGSFHPMTFGVDSFADFWISDLSEYINGYYAFTLSYLQKKIADIKMNIAGIHNIYNAAAAMAISYLLKVPAEDIKSGIENFKGVKRRFERKGMIKGTEVYHDYAHHPSEIRAVLESARKIAKGKLITVFQPHTFSRTSLLIDEFSKAFLLSDEVYIVKEYSARENQSQGLSAYDLFKKIENSTLFYYDEILSLAKTLIKKAQPFDMILVLGAGDIDKLCDLLV